MSAEKDDILRQYVAEEGSDANFHIIHLRKILIKTNRLENY